MKIDGEAPDQRPGDGDYFSRVIEDAAAPGENTADHAAVEWFHNTAPADAVTASQPFFIPAKVRPQIYDANPATAGQADHLTSDGVFTYKWDAEDRLVRIEHTSSQPQFRKKFRYDYMSRRVEERYFLEDTASGGPDVTWQTYPEYTRRYIYDGYTMVAELDVSYSATGQEITTTRRTFAWGHETAGGGIGALLLIEDHQNDRAYYPGYDGRGSVTLLVDADTGEKVAGIEYDIWGKIVRGTGEWRATPFLYDTKWSLDQGAGGAYPHWPIGLYDYGFRYYQPATGRFINRDPIREQGGHNLYQAFAGDPVNRTDFLGLWFTEDDDGEWWMDNDFYTDEDGNWFMRYDGVEGRGRPSLVDGDPDPDYWFWKDGLNEQPYIEPYDPVAAQRKVNTRARRPARETARGRENDCAKWRNLLVFAQASRAAYGEHAPPPGFEPLGSPIETESGMGMTIFHNEESGAVIGAFRGTRIPFETSDLIANAMNLAGRSSAQHSQASQIARGAAYHHSGIVFTGHSLGGGHAALASMITENPGVTFAAAGLSRGTMRREGAERSMGSHVRNYLAPRDPIVGFQIIPGIHSPIGRTERLPYGDVTGRAGPGGMQVIRDDGGHSINGIIRLLEAAIRRDCGDE